MTFGLLGGLGGGGSTTVVPAPTPNPQLMFLAV